MFAKREVVAVAPFRQWGSCKIGMSDTAATADESLIGQNTCPPAPETIYFCMQSSLRRRNCDRLCCSLAWSLFVSSRNPFHSSSASHPYFCLNCFSPSFRRRRRHHRRKPGALRTCLSPLLPAQMIGSDNEARKRNESRLF